MVEYTLYNCNFNKLPNSWSKNVRNKWEIKRYQRTLKEYRIIPSGNWVVTLVFSEQIGLGSFLPYCQKIRFNSNILGSSCYDVFHPMYRPPSNYIRYYQKRRNQWCELK